MSKRVTEAASLELAFLAALDGIHADVDTSEIGEIQDWSTAVRGKFYGVAVKDASDLSKRSPNATNEPVSSPRGIGGIVLGGSSNAASHGSVQYSQMAIPQLIAVCTFEPSEGAWSEFVRRFQPLIATVITKVVRRFRNVSSELVDDLTQDVFLKLCHANFRILRHFETHHENAFVGFLKIVASNTAQDYFRNAASSDRGFRKSSEADLVSLESVPIPHAAFETEGRIALADIDRALKTLSHEPNFQRDYEIFWLYYRNGYTATEIAALPGTKLTVKGVESTLLRLTRRVRSALTQGNEKNS
jgi:RNA polymerase sigma-70 factor (ECF subfamily)